MATQFSEEASVRRVPTISDVFYFPVRLVHRMRGDPTWNGFTLFLTCAELVFSLFLFTFTKNNVFGLYFILQVILVLVTVYHAFSGFLVSCYVFVLKMVTVLIFVFGEFFSGSSHIPIFFPNSEILSNPEVLLALSGLFIFWWSVRLHVTRRAMQCMLLDALCDCELDEDEV